MQKLIKSFNRHLLLLLYSINEKKILIIGKLILLVVNVNTNLEYKLKPKIYVNSCYLLLSIQISHFDLKKKLKCKYFKF